MSTKGKNANNNKQLEPIIENNESPNSSSSSIIFIYVKIPTIQYHLMMKQFWKTFQQHPLPLIKEWEEEPEARRAYLIPITSIFKITLINLNHE